VKREVVGMMLMGIHRDHGEMRMKRWRDLVGNSDVVGEIGDEMRKTNMRLEVWKFVVFERE
jgi:hypothetical protein